MIEATCPQVSDERKAKYAEDHSKGWQYYLGRLRDVAAPHTSARE